MPEGFAQIDGRDDAWLVGGRESASFVYAVRDVRIPWSSGSPDVIGRAVTAVLLPDAVTRFDRNAGPYLLATYQGAGLAYLIRESDRASIDALLAVPAGGAATWRVLRRLLRGVSVDWQGG